MSTNPYFRNYNSAVEQHLIDDLVIESIKIHGIDVFYVRRTLQNEDNILNEASVSVFDKAFNIEMYVKSFDGFQGQGDILSKWGGPEINDQMTLTVAIRTFDKTIKKYDAKMNRPREGDIVFFPLNQKFFEIKFVEHESVFYQGGTLFVYDLKCELLKFTNQTFNTGIDLIDDYSVDFNTTEIDDMEELNKLDPISKNIFFEDEGEILIDDTEFDPFKDILITSLKRD